MMTILARWSWDRFLVGTDSGEVRTLEARMTRGVEMLEATPWPVFGDSMMVPVVNPETRLFREGVVETFEARLVRLVSYWGRDFGPIQVAFVPDTKQWYVRGAKQ